MKISIIICTHNPNYNYLQKTFDAIKKQSFPNEEYEVVVIDNGSTPPVLNQCFSFPSNTRIVKESMPGIMKARMRGALEAKGQWILFLDDDNIIDNYYLASGYKIIQEHPTITLFCGIIKGEFEIKEPNWLKNFHANLAVINFKEDTWSSNRDFTKIPSWTAGMYIKKNFALEYYKLVKNDPFRINLKRCEDVDMVIYATSKNKLCGKFTKLKMTHIIPKERMTYKYISKIVKETNYIMGTLHAKESIYKNKLIYRAIINYLLKSLFLLYPTTTAKIKYYASWHYLLGVKAK